MKFQTAYSGKISPSQDFNHKKITFRKAGKDINIYDLTQAGREDTEIYPTLEKYGILPSVETAAQFLANRAGGFYAEFEQMMDLRDFHEIRQRSNEMWQDLPQEIRDKFHNDKEEFMNEGLDWLKAQMQPKEEVKEVKQTEANNEQK